ncbi:hypothetical protein Poli38472_011562 [Pythium oligandrum]|uniref:Uncharacterized protein n=1 Tax=Pythium oligandrum TaxID=41045 RepID=A0A8K1FMB2_PYTOL|nr:hypothetical protein Poli38472_011562 [Pythium oligandrum]|eukprot:TMW64682.1 hypothetical protein Poli38472_011562 [Pythium oligandrum]
MLSMESPPPPPSSKTSRTSTTVSKKKTEKPGEASSLLRSPTRRSAPIPTPPPVAPLPRPDVTASSSILMPSKAPVRTQTVRQEGEFKSEGGEMVETVNPVDVLAKKLRQQATELTQVYERMEEKDEVLDKMRAELHELTGQLEQQKKLRREAIMKPVRPVYTSKTPSKAPLSIQKANSVSSSVPKSRAKSPKKTAAAGANELVVSETEETTMQRVEVALNELQVFHGQFRQRIASSQQSNSLVLTEDDVNREQQLYIRVLEEAVHLKASELQITGHEELLVVLAELRHTIYQQEQDVGELHKTISALKSEVSSTRQVKIDMEQQYRRDQAQWEQERRAFKEKESTLQNRIDETQRLVHQEHLRFRDEQVKHTEINRQLSKLEDELRAKSKAVTESVTQSAQWHSREAHLKVELEETRRKLEQKQEEATQTRRELDAAKRQVDELKILQEGLLSSVDQFVAKEHELETRNKDLQTQLEKSRQICSKQSQQDELVISMQGRIETLLAENQDLATKSQLWNECDRLATLMNDTLGRREDSREPENEACTSLHGLMKSCEAVCKSKPTDSQFQWLYKLFQRLLPVLASIEEKKWRWKEEEADFRASCTALQATTEMTEAELHRLRTQLQATQSELHERDLMLEKTRLDFAAMEEEVKRAEAERDVQAALTDQVLALERIVKSQQQHLQEVLFQNKELMTLETELAVQIDAKDDQMQRLEKQIARLKEHSKRMEGLEEELESAAALSEDQNMWNQQLVVELETTELTLADQELTLETLKTREDAFQSSFSLLFNRFKQVIQANTSNRTKRRQVYDQAEASGDILEMLRVFPTLVEEYVAASMLGYQDHTLPTKPPHLRQVPPLRPTAPLKPTDLDTSLQLIHEAFHRFQTPSS